MCLEAHILFSGNKTTNWLNSKSDEQKEYFLTTARKMACSHKAKFKERLEAITEKRIAAIQQKQAEAERKQKKVLEEKEALTSSIVIQGLWKLVHGVDSKLSRIHSEAAKQKAIQTQLKFRKVYCNKLTVINKYLVFLKRELVSCPLLA